MDVLKAQLLKIQQQLSGLNASQKMLTASLVAIMIMTMLWWARYAGNAEMQPVLDQPLSVADIGQIKSVLDSRGIPAQIAGDRVMVPSDRKVEAMAILAYSNALPSNSTAAWDEMIKQMSPWDTSSKTQVMHNNMRERMLSHVITSFFPGIAQANVVIQPGGDRRIGRPVEPAASVQIRTRGHEGNINRLVESVAATVASAVPGLKRSAVAVVIDGVTRRAHESRSGYMGGDLIEQIDALEKSRAEKIATMLPPGSLVAVAVDLETVSSEEIRETYDPKATFTKETRTETTSEETSQPPAPAVEAGAVPNMGLTLNGASPADGPAHTREVAKTENQVFASVSRETLHKPAGKPTVLSAAVRLPRSYFIAKFRQSNPSAQEPDDASLQPLVDAELPGIREAVLRSVSIKSENDISVGLYDDGQLPMLAASENATTDSGVGALVSRHGREIALGVLAVVSLFMVSTIVKKSSPQPVIAVSPEPRETPRLAGGEDLVGIVGGDINPTLDGMEVDDDAIKAQQVVDQVSTLVKEDPEAAATLVKRWLNRS